MSVVVAACAARMPGAERPTNNAVTDTTEITTIAISIRLIGTLPIPLGTPSGASLGPTHLQRRELWRDAEHFTSQSPVRAHRQGPRGATGRDRDVAVRATARTRNWR